MEFTNAKRVVLGVGLLLLILNGLFPPCHWSVPPDLRSFNHEGRQFLFSLPFGAKIMWDRFLMQFVTIIAAIAGAFILTGMRMKEGSTNTETNQRK